MQLNTTESFRTVMVFLAARQWHASRPYDHRYGERRSPSRIAHYYPGDRRSPRPTT